MKKKNTVPYRIDSEFAKDLNDALMFRVKNGLITSKREMSIPEITNLIRRTESWKGVMFELKTKPKRRAND